MKNVKNVRSFRQHSINSARHQLFNGTSAHRLVSAMNSWITTAIEIHNNWQMTEMIKNKCKTKAKLWAHLGLNFRWRLFTFYEMSAENKTWIFLKSEKNVKYVFSNTDVKKFIARFLNFHRKGIVKIVRHLAKLHYHIFVKNIVATLWFTVVSHPIFVSPCNNLS